jgi:DNA-binding transcriptional regulator PaaX
LSCYGIISIINIIIYRYEVKNCKAFYRYSKANSLSAFKKHADKYMTKNEEPQDQPDPRLVQSVINTDGSTKDTMKKECWVSLLGILSKKNN